MSLLSKLFGGKSGSDGASEPVVFQEFSIFAEPQRDGGGYRIAARIEKTIDGEVKTHQMIRADTCQSADEARELSVTKAKILIDQQGESIFD